MKQTVFILLIIILFQSCSNSKNSALLVGNWQGAEWLVNGHASEMDAKGTSFNFKANSEYTFDYAGTIEKGNYKVVDDKLYTTPYDQQEIMVRIEKLTTDTLIFDMNRGGQPETLVLVRKQ